MQNSKILLFIALLTLFVNSAIIQTAVAPTIAAAAKCVPRKEIIARGQRWVDKKVPYSQSKTFQGYRTDCSGFVSMCWGIKKPGLATFTMSASSISITKDQLKEGDAINCPHKHMLLFVGWTDSKRTHYIAMEEANSKTGTVKRTVPYPYWGGDKCFKPIRFKNVC